MRQWRVGRISLGLIFVGAGAALLSWLLSGTALPNLYLKWWPICLLILGLEILASTWQRGEEPARFSYDGFSIVLIFFIVVGSFGLSMLNGLGLTNQIVSELSATPQQYTFTPQQVTIPENVERVVVTSQQGQVRVLTSDTRICTVQGEMNGAASSELWEQAAPKATLSTRVVGNTLLVDLPNPFQTASLGHHVYQARYDIVLPRHLPVEINTQQYGQLDLRLSGVQKDWLIKGNATVDITADANDDLRIKSMGQDREMLDGNVKWEASEGGSTALFGSGKTTINVMSSGPIRVYTE